MTKISLRLTLPLIASLAVSSAAQAVDTLVVAEDQLKGPGIAAAAAEFEKQNNCKIIIDESVGISDQFTHYADLQQKGQTDRIPDIFEVISDRFEAAVHANLIQPLPLMEKDRSLYLENAVESFTYDGKTYGFPRSIEALVVFYNKDVLEYPFETLEEYDKYGKERVKQGKYGLVGRIDQFYYGFGFLNAYGAKIFGRKADGTYNPYDVQLNNPGVEKGLETLANFMRDNMPVKDFLGENGWTLPIQMLSDGRAAALISGPWDVFALAASGVNYGVAPLPKLEGDRPLRPFYGAKAYVVSAYSKHADLAQRFLQFINQPQHALTRYQQIGELPPINKLLEDPVITNDDFANAIGEQVLNADPMPAIKEICAVWAPMVEAILSAGDDKTDPRQALNDAVDKINSMIE